MTTHSPTPESSKQRALRIVLDYHRRGDRLVRSKYFWTFIGTLVALAYVAWLFVGGTSAQQQLSPGSLAAVHSSLNSDCAKCHQNFKPLSADASGSRMLLAAFHETHPAKVSCRDCHPQQTDLPHHPNQLSTDEMSCAACHVDHQGSGAQLARPADRTCTVCHEDMASHRTRSQFEPALQSVAQFARLAPEQFAHPGFRSLPAEDKNDFKFNHQLHLLPGQWPKDGKPEGAWKLGQIPAELREQFKTSPDQSLDSLVQLDCSSCHVTATTDSGAYMLPVNFERHCQACHSLTVAKTLGGNTQTWNIRHGLKQLELRDVLLGISASVEKQDSSATKLSPNSPLGPPLPVPGRTPGFNLAQQLGDPGQVDAWQKSLFREQCLKCHTDASALSAKEAEPIDFLKPRIPERWFTHGAFNHRTHEAWANCRDCHAGAYATDATGKPPIDDQRVLVPNIDNCVQCHASKSTHEKFKATARFDCAECHRYHPTGAQPHVAP
ncbi:cytochrome c3 family protein [Anatilimnocola floriformis]|uniref:cytochrome c3 family protein n=1 Tax=Anatilimnocola floriformis TaxID=2948575 RepID=UPI0020C5348F|nr:cytochrome c3 family protein [Anatilimnocola floriformis]